MLDELNRQKLMKRYNQHVAGLTEARHMLFNNVKPYTYRPLKNKPVPMPDQGLGWKPMLANPLIDLNPPSYRMTVYD